MQEYVKGGSGCKEVADTDVAGTEISDGAMQKNY